MINIMASSGQLLSRLVSSAVSVVNNAGNIIRDIMSKGDLGIVTKEHAKDLQTAADRAAQLYIVGSLYKHFPNIKVIGEEDEVGIGTDNLLNLNAVSQLNTGCPEKLANLKEEQVVVWVDPLDGTAEYTQGLLDHVTVLVGIASGGNVIGGVIHQPYFNYKQKDLPLGRTIWAVVGGKIGGIDIIPPPKEGCIVTTTRSHSSSTVNDAISSLNPTQVLRVGGAGHKVLLLLDGSAHAYVFASPGCKKWDTCAPQAILEAAGGYLTDIKGDQIPYGADVPYRNSTGVLGTAPGLQHDSILQKIPQHVKENLKA